MVTFFLVLGGDSHPLGKTRVKPVLSKCDYLSMIAMIETMYFEDYDD